MERDVQIIINKHGHKLVQINKIIFMGKQNIDWNYVETYIKQYIDSFYCIAETSDLIYIGKDLPDEYSNSKYSKSLRGALAKAKANASQAIPELIEISTGKTFQENLNPKHLKNAKNGWYRYDAHFSIPVANNQGDIIKFNVFKARLVIRHADDGKKYLYDIINIKKETEYTA